jgi:2-polyprenyl-3-methyl-5-hydroxy-6-metoxy-1,4-benzoquinol methylase
MNIIFDSEVAFDATLDLSCGTGLITDILMKKGITDIIGCDPYLNKEYTENTTKESIDLSFNDIQHGKLFGKRYDSIVCSYAMHLIEPSRLNQVLWNLCLVSNYLVLLSPNNRPFITDEESYELIDKGKVGKCKYRVYKSRYANRPLKKK